MLLMAEFPDLSLHLFDDSEFQMRSSARFREIDATDLLEMRENNQNKNTQRSTKNWVKVFDLWRAERSEVRKLEEIPKHELDDVLWTTIGNRTTCLSNLETIEFKKFLGLPNWTRPTALSNFGCPQNFSYPIISKLDSV